MNPVYMLSTPEGAQVAIDTWLDEGGMDRLATEVHKLATQNGVIDGLGLWVLVAMGEAVSEMISPSSRGTDAERSERARAIYTDVAEKLREVLATDAVHQLPPPGLYRAQCEGWLSITESMPTRHHDPILLWLSVRDVSKGVEVMRSLRLTALRPMLIEGWLTTDEIDGRIRGWADLNEPRRRHLRAILPAILAWKYDGGPAPWTAGRDRRRRARLGRRPGETP